MPRRCERLPVSATHHQALAGPDDDIEVEPIARLATRGEAKHRVVPALYGLGVAGRNGDRRAELPT